jgi:hypothetical protein
MSGKKFENQMEEWALHETSLAPELKPTNEMVQMVKEKRKKPNFRVFWPRSSHVGVVLAAVSLIFITYLSLYKPIFLTRNVPEQLAYVSQREVRLPKAPITQLITPPQEKGESRRSEIHQLAELQIHRGDPHRIVALDLRADMFKPVSLSSQDSFRLLMKTNQPRYLYIYQFYPPQKFQPLHPRVELQPMPPNQKVFLPVKPDWFFLSGDPGEYTLFIISSPSRILELEDLYEEYSQSLDPSINPIPDPEAPQKAASALHSYILSIKAAASPGVELWQLEFFLENDL